MDISLDRNDPTLDDAMTQLAQMEAEEAQLSANPAAAAAAAAPASATPGARAPETSPAAVIPPPGATPAAGAPATEVTPAAAAAAAAKTPEQIKAEADAAAAAAAQPGTGSKFAKNQQRLEGGWRTLNQEKADFAASQAAFKQREAELAKREKTVEQARLAANQPKYKPEAYEKAATKWDGDIAGLEAQAKKLDGEGKFDEAEKCKEQAAVLRSDAKKAREYAGHLRANPPAPVQTDAQAETEFRALQKEWWGKAGIDFPAVLKADSPESEALKALIKAEPAVVNDPKGMYYGARLVCAETSSARVPGLEKELGALRAKVKDLSEKLAVPIEGAAAPALGELPFEQKSAEEQESELYRQAAELDARGTR